MKLKYKFMLLISFLGIEYFLIYYPLTWERGDAVGWNILWVIILAIFTWSINITIWQRVKFLLLIVVIETIFNLVTPMHLFPLLPLNMQGYLIMMFMIWIPLNWSEPKDTPSED